MFRPRTSPEAIDLVSKLLEYTPEARLSAIESMVHPFFDELRVESTRLQSGKDLPKLFNFTKEGKLLALLGLLLNSAGFSILTRYSEMSIRPDLNRQLVPPFIEPELRSRGIDLDTFVPIPPEQVSKTKQGASLRG